MKFSEKAYANKAAITGHTVIDVVLLAAYVIEWVKGARSGGYLLIIACFMILPLIAEWILYARDRESKVVRHIMGTTYSLFYIFAIFTTSSPVAFAYALPMYMVITLYMDTAYCAAIASGGFLANVACVIYQAVTAGYGADEIKNAEIQLACMALTGIYMVTATVGIRKSHRANIQEIQMQQAKTDQLLQNVLQVSDRMSEGVAAAADKMVLVKESVEHIRSSMQEVSAGSNESAQSIQNQMQKTEQIQNYIGKVQDTADFIRQNVSDTARKAEEGKNQMDSLARQVEKSMNANRQVQDKMQELRDYTERMNTIIETITSIAGSTGMLALNASIEAARAGEAGRGFAVVAGQISGLANQTKTATVDITELIENIHKELEDVFGAVNVVMESNRANADSARVVQENFGNIAQGTQDIAQQTGELTGVVKELGAANGQIVESIQTLSAITEEVSAHANETYEACEENGKLVEKAVDIVQELSRDAELLRSSR